MSTSPSMSEMKRSFSSPLTMNREKCTVPSWSCVFREIGHQRGQLFGERLGIRGSLDREVNREMALAHAAFSFATPHSESGPAVGDHACSGKNVRSADRGMSVEIAVDGVALAQAA